MTNKEIAERLRNLPMGFGDTPLTEGILGIADTLDPPRPEMGTAQVFWWRYYDDIDWKGPTTMEALERVMFRGIEYKPARILAPDEVPVKVPPVSEWPEDGTHVEAAVTGMSDDWWFAEVLSRDEAERMEAER